MAPELVAEALAVALVEVVFILDDLERRKIFLFRPGGREVAWAYPVTVEPTPITSPSAAASSSTPPEARTRWRRPGPGRLRNEPLTFDVRTECAHCGQAIRFRMRHDLSYEIEQADCAPLFFVPLVRFCRASRRRASSTTSEGSRYSFWSEEHAAPPPHARRRHGPLPHPRTERVLRTPGAGHPFRVRPLPVSTSEPLPPTVASQRGA